MVTTVRRRRHGPRLPFVYELATLAGFLLLEAGVAQVFVPAALVIAGLAIGALGLIGLGVRGTQP